MAKFRNFIRTSLIGGLGVLLPATILIFLFRWLHRFITNLIQPLTDQILANEPVPEFLADLVVIVMIIGICFFVGVFVKTRLGRFFHDVVEKRFLKRIPGYTIIKETVGQFIGSDQASPFKQVALAKIFGNETRVICFVTAKEGGYYTVFVPTAPNPTSGNIFILPERDVELKPDASIELTMRNIISCGIGSESLIKSN